VSDPGGGMFSTLSAILVCDEECICEICAFSNNV